jgi:glycerophosphoryl diester phosphodiesterase
MRFAVTLLLAALAVPASAQEIVAEPVLAPEPAPIRPLVIAHRGASGERPEETLAAYERALDLGADWIEGDLVPTLDGALVLRHENELSVSTDVADHPEFANRKTTKIVDGMTTDGWFSEDFTLDELRTLRARERLPELRPANTRFDRLYPLATLGELLQLMQAKEAELGRPVTLLLELKHPTYFAGLGHDLAALMLAELERGGYGNGDPRIVMQNFEVGVLCRLSETTEYKTVQLVDAEGAPADVPAVPYAAMLESAGLAVLKRCADAIGPSIALVLNLDGTPAPLVAAAREAGLPLYPWTLRRENAFLPPQLRRGADQAAVGDVQSLAYLLTVAGVAGIITDNTADVVALQQARP